MKFTQNQRKVYLLALTLLIAAIALACTWSLWQPPEAKVAPKASPVPTDSVKGSYSLSPAWPEYSGHRHPAPVFPDKIQECFLLLRCCPVRFQVRDLLPLHRKRPGLPYESFACGRLLPERQSAPQETGSSAQPAAPVRHRFGVLPCR